ncbi:MAG: DUF11 domain-containing protein [Saprospiraceae bacterium]|nr:DUF11 domain-containing protein [Saprospiraceae bacterium]
MQDDNGDPRDDDDADSTPDVDPDNDNPVTPGDDNDDEVDESPNDPDTNDDDEDDSDPAGPKIFDLALRKVQLTATPSFSYGQTVMFGIQLFNQGNVDAKDIVIVDTLPCGLEFLPTSAVNIAAGWVYNPVTREVRTTYGNILAAGTSVQFSLDNKVVPCYSSVGKAWTNWAEIGSANDNDPNTPNPPVDIDRTLIITTTMTKVVNQILLKMMKSMVIQITLTTHQHHRMKMIMIHIKLKYLTLQSAKLWTIEVPTELVKQQHSRLKSI